MNRDFDNLTPLDARNSLLISSPLTEYKGRQTDPGMTKAPLVSTSLHTTTTENYSANTRYDPVQQRETSPPGYSRSLSRPRLMGSGESRENLVSGAASIGGRDESPAPSFSTSGQGIRQPRLPAVDFGHSF